MRHVPMRRLLPGLQPFRFPSGSTARLVVAYVAAGLVLTIVSVVLHRTIAPATGLVRTFYPHRSFLGAPSAR